MQDFLTLSPYYRDRPLLTSAAADYIRGEAFRTDVKNIQASPQELARLTLGLLKQLALDPQRGVLLGDFVQYAGEAPELEKLTATSDSIWFCLHFNRVTNFIGSFTLLRSAPETELLLKAIQDNLDSKIFKAARMHRRLAAKMHKSYSRIYRLGREAHQKIMDASKSEKYALAFRGAAEWNTSARLLREELYDAAARAQEDVVAPLKARLENRLGAVANAAFGEDFCGGYTEILTAFAVHYIIPEQPGDCPQAL
jgi:hypothetical protein